MTILREKFQACGWARQTFRDGTIEIGYAPPLASDYSDRHRWLDRFLPVLLL
jgi:hypothetical protein